MGIEVQSCVDYDGDIIAFSFFHNTHAAQQNKNFIINIGMIVISPCCNNIWNNITNNKNITNKEFTVNEKHYLKQIYK